jgi:hypothetical protein
MARFLACVISRLGGIFSCLISEPAWLARPFSISSTLRINWRTVSAL